MNQDTTPGPDAATPRVLDGARARRGDGDARDLDALFDRIASETVDRRPTLRDRLLELATPLRVGLVLLAVLGLAAIVLGLFGVRPALSGPELWRFLALQGGVLGASLVGVALALRPTWRRPLGPLGWSVGLALVALPLLLSVVPGLWPGMARPVPAIADVMCGVAGLLVALPATAVVLLFERDRRTPAWRVLLAAGAAGLAAFAMGQAHCPAVHPAHLLISHAGHGVLAGVVALLALTVSRRLSRRHSSS